MSSEEPKDKTFVNEGREEKTEAEKGNGFRRYVCSE